jgi:hypothetical protein
VVAIFGGDRNRTLLLEPRAAPRDRVRSVSGLTLLGLIIEKGHLTIERQPPVGRARS